MRYSFGGIILVTIGLLMLLDNLDYLDFGDVIQTYWPLILVFWGFVILRRRKKQPQSQETVFAAHDVQQTVASELVHESNAFGDVFVSISSQNFKGGSVSTTFGDCDIDLSKAAFAEGEHLLRIHGVFGDCQITLPKDSPVAISASSTLGDITIFGQKKDGFSPSMDISSPAYANSMARLKIVISRVFGSVRVS
ncbi:MAG: hypothetical protein EPO24_13750 [Bacteroidetes bacterium]|nr:MAG: hypothetical protein EPO24_13750 [Bacteroidota bacterium]